MTCPKCNSQYIVLRNDLRYVAPLVDKKHDKYKCMGCEMLWAVPNQVSVIERIKEIVGNDVLAS